MQWNILHHGGGFLDLEINNLGDCLSLQLEGHKGNPVLSGEVLASKIYVHKKGDKHRS